MPLTTGQKAAIHPVGAKVVALAAVLLFSGLNIFNLRWAGRTQNLVSGLALLTILGVVIAGFALGRGDWGRFAFTPLKGAWGDIFGPAMVSVFFTYSGWFVAAYVASEMKGPRRWLPPVLALSALVVTVLYLLVNALYVYALPVKFMQGVVDIMRLACDSMGALCRNGLPVVWALGAAKDSGPSAAVQASPWKEAWKGKSYPRRIHAHTPHGRDGGHPPHRQTPGAAAGPRASIVQSVSATGLVADQPFVNRAPTHAQGLGHGGYCGAEAKGFVVRGYGRGGLF